MSTVVGNEATISTDDLAANMKMITAIYLNCRPDLKDDWLGGTDQDTEVEDALVRLLLISEPLRLAHA